MAWSQEPTDCYLRARRYYVKKHQKELDAVERNLNTYFTALSMGAKPAQIKYGFVHAKYRLGVFSITQQGGGKNLAQTRLYVYPDTPNEVLWLLTLGDKNTQPDDVQLCYTLVAGSAADPAEDKDDGTQEEPVPPGGGDRPDQAGREGPVREHG